MTDEQIIAKANEAIAEEFEFDMEDMTPETRLVEDLELDTVPRT